MIGLLRVAMMAPSLLGAQPWRYRARLGSQTIELYADRERTRRLGDPSGRMTVGYWAGGTIETGQRAWFSRA